MTEGKKTERLEGSLTDGGSLPGEHDERGFGAGRRKRRLPGGGADAKKPAGENGGLPRETPRGGKGA